ncbi:MAG: hypothetical protein JW822_11450 [Spirochaetales bacterium]|nr:hypothetical protein [Spirochaetales bacterium]
MMELHDDKKTYCRKLGHHLTFQYCRREKQGLPCKKIIDCWFDKFNIQNYLKEYYKMDELAHIFETPRPKMETLVELIRQAQQRMP